MDRMNFDLFQLHSKKVDKSPLSWIEAKGKGLVKVVNSILEKVMGNGNFSQAQISSKIRSNLRCGDSTMKKKISYIQREIIEWIPICLVIELLNYLEKDDQIKFKKKFISKVEYLKINNSSSSPIKSVKKMSKDLAKILGAHVADGYLQIYTKKNGHKNYVIKIMEGDKQAIVKLNSWFNNVFGLKTRIIFSERDNAWVVYFTNKVIVRYFTKIFGIHKGKKSHSIGLPKILQESTIDIKKEFLKGYLTFDGGVKLTGYIAFSTMSNNLKMFLESIMNELGIEYSLNKNKSDAYIFEIMGNEKCIDLFEDGTEKWYKLYENFNGFQGKITEEKNLLEVLDKVYPSKGINKTNIKEVYNAIKENKVGNIDKILSKINQEGYKVAKTTLYKYLNILLGANIIKKKEKVISMEKYGFRTTNFLYNDNLREWRVPWRPWLSYTENNMKGD